MFGTLQLFIVQILTVLAFGLEVFALFDAACTRADAFYVAGKLTKNRWLVILGVATALGFISLPSLPLFGGGKALEPFSMLSIIAVVAAGVYLADVRPAVRQIRGGGGGSKSGPYGPW